jgi:dihydrofolate reductase
MKSGKTVVLVAAVGENGVIGRDGGLPWRLKSDLQHFKKLTVGKPVIMGRKTFESIGKALKDRTNIVLTRDLGLAAPDAVLATSMEAAFACAATDADRRGVGEIMVIGGGDVFDAAMEVADRLEITRVHASPQGDSFFPAIDPQIWRETSRERRPRGPQDEADFTILTYQRIR